ncbi:MAG: hypothetical protein ACRYG8_42280 [Janthinobacterium lividum]
MKGLTDIRRMLSPAHRATKEDSQDELGPGPDRVFVPEGQSANHHLIGVDPDILMREIRVAARRAGLDERDPLSPLLTTLTRVIPFMSQLTRDNMREGMTQHKRMVETLSAAHLTAKARTEEFQAGLALIEAKTIERVGDAIAVSAKDALVRKTAVAEFGVLVGLMAMMLTIGGVLAAVGYDYRGTIDATKLAVSNSVLSDAMQGDPASVDVWVRLIRANSGMQQRVHDCLIQAGYVSDGRAACKLPVFVGVDPRLAPDSDRPLPLVNFRP